MATGVGLHIAEHACTAAVVSDGRDPHFVLREPILHMSEEGDAVLGGAVPPPGHTHTITDFVSAVGDPAGVAVDEGEAYRGEDLLATAMFCLIDLASEYLAGPAEFYATHPGDWGGEQVLALRGALDYLGLKSVALIGEDEFPGPPAGLTPTETGRYFAEGAGRAALAVVLDTPAGATPPDPTTAENSFLDTVIMPKLRDGDTPAKAYSAVVPAVDPEATYGGPSLGVLAAGLGTAGDSPAASGTVAAVPADAPSSAPAATAKKPGAPARRPAVAARHRTALLVAAATVVGLVLGGAGVAAFLRTGAAEPGPPPPAVTETPTPELPPVPPEPVAPPPTEPTYIPEPTYEPEPTYPEEPPAPPEPPVTITTTTEPPATTTEPPATGLPSGPTLSEPSSTESTTEPRTTTRRPPGFEFFPFPMPFRTEDPDLPDTGSKEGRQEEAR
ncbi:hypothetical protein [Nocardia sp. X0981]